MTEPRPARTAFTVFVAVMYGVQVAAVGYIAGWWW